MRATALAALARAGAVIDAELATAISDPDAAVRRRAVEVVARVGVLSPRATSVSLIALLDDPDDSVVEVAAWACGERTPPEPGAVTRLCALTTDHPDPLVRESAVAALGAIGDEQGLPAILAAASDKATVRRRAILALAPFDGPEVREALARARTDRDWQVRQAAEDLGAGPVR